MPDRQSVSGIANQLEGSKSIGEKAAACLIALVARQVPQRCGRKLAPGVCAIGDTHKDRYPHRGHDALVVDVIICCQVPQRTGRVPLHGLTAAPCELDERLDPSSRRDRDLVLRIVGGELMERACRFFDDLPAEGKTTLRGIAVCPAAPTQRKRRGRHETGGRYEKGQSGWTPPPVAWGVVSSPQAGSMREGESDRIFENLRFTGG